MKKCYCHLILRIPEEKVFVHLLGCPKESYSIEYEKMPWHKKIFKKSPERFYNDFFKP